MFYFKLIGITSLFKAFTDTVDPRYKRNFDLRRSASIELSEKRYFILKHIKIFEIFIIKEFFFYGILGEISK